MFLSFKIIQEFFSDATIFSIIWESILNILPVYLQIFPQFEVSSLPVLALNVLYVSALYLPWPVPYRNQIAVEPEGRLNLQFLVAGCHSG